MNGHPGGREHTCRMLVLAELPHGARILDLGAGAGEAVKLMNESGFHAEGIDLAPRAEWIRKGDLLHAPFPDGSFDAVMGHRLSRRPCGENRPAGPQL